ncbi:MAG: NUDIX hydrolase [Ferrovum sp.]|jgi:hypothetical protein|uniref:DUF2213 domain-containing protein n=1 Tax=Ferrovum sp. TaxID=2609467 RepID=UPI002629D5E2|nr:DUF2213 domain-containing protein [Ferrovum sp.]MBW8066842.1 NUDIX hydrolase [Ferrovum sp.]
MPSVSEAQHRAMEAAAHGHSTIGIPEKVGKEFVKHDEELPPRKGGMPRPDDGESFITIEPEPGEFMTLPIKDDTAERSPTEYDIAKAIKSGELPSPQSFMSIDLYDMRITGTGTSFRPKNNEHVYRPPENFLTEDFVNRCNGLPVVFEHPKGPSLDTDEFRDRSIGTIILPYIKGDDVWGIARIYDKDASELMKSSHPSTSPAVIFGPHDGNQQIEFDDGTHLLIEGIPSYLDHLAICPEGVWDKGEGPSGINIGDEKMPEVEKDAKKDGSGEEAPSWMDKLDAKLDAISERLDRLDEKDRKDSEEKEKEEKDRKDASEKELEKKEHKEEGKDIKELEEAHKKEGKEEKDRKDSEEKEKAEKDRKDADKKDRGDRMDSIVRENAVLRDRLASIESKVGRISTETPADQREIMAQAQSRADSIGSALGFQVSAPMSGETALAYRKRLVSKVVPFIKNESLKKIRFDSLDEASFAGFEDMAYAAVADSVADPNVTAGNVGGLYYQKVQQLGREVMIPRGDSAAFIGRHSSPGYVMKGGFKKDFAK